ncbi:MAG: histidine kinase [Bacteroidota bacterium]
MSNFNPDLIGDQPTVLLKTYADTSLTLPRIAAYANDHKKLDTLIYYAEWLKNYEENIALSYAQKAYDLATEKNWNFPRAVSLYRIAGIKGRKAIFGEDIEDAMVDAKICQRLIRPYNNIYWNVNINNLLGYLFKRKSQLDSARHYFELALNETEKLKLSGIDPNEFKAIILHNLGTSCELADTVNRIAYYQQSDSLYQTLELPEMRTRLMLDQANYFMWLKKYKEADHLLNRCSTLAKENNYTDILSRSNQIKGELFYKIYYKTDSLIYAKKAIHYLQKCLNLNQENRHNALEFLGMTYHLSWFNDVEESHADSAVRYYRLAITRAREKGALSLVKTASNSLANLCAFTGMNCDTLLGKQIELFFNNNYAALVDTITSHSKIAYQRINKVEQRDIMVAAANKRKNQIMIGAAIFALAGIAFLFLYQRQQTRRLKAEMEALRAQINPHFISNSLNAIESLVNLGNAKAAAKYLVHFSRLSRQILNGSRSATTTLSEELKTLKHFLALEQLRFRDKLTYEFMVDPGVQAESVVVPAMILQPYVENAIWHGIKPKPDGGHVQIRVSQAGKILICEIKDDGVGREQSKAMRKASVLKHKSMGMQITEERLKAMGQIKGSQVEVIDLVDDDGKPAGTKVVIQFKYQIKKTEKL